MRDVLVLVDLFDDFSHESGDVLRASLAQRLSALTSLIDRARQAAIPIVYVNDRHDRWHGDRTRFLREIQVAAGGDATWLDRLQPAPPDAFLFKDRYSGFEHTALDLRLRGVACERIVLAGMTLEGCVAQTAIDARERGYKVSIPTEACPRADEQAARVAVEYLEMVVGVCITDLAGVSDQDCRPARS
jgi:nicotinamidase-related amidase